MKKVFSIAMLLFALTGCALAKPMSEIEYAMVHGAKARLVLYVHDDDGNPVEGANVRVVLGMNFDVNLVDGVTSEKGEFLIEGKTTGYGIKIFVSKPGWYESRSELCLVDGSGAYQVVSGKWQPWGERRNILFRKIHNPVLPDNILKILRVPETNEWIGVDLEMADWIHPYGKGRRTDFEMRTFWDGLPPAESLVCRYEIRVCGVGNGYYVGKKATDSYYTEVYRADKDNGFALQTLESSYRGNPRSMDFWKQHEAVFRVRTILDEEARVLSANYAALRYCAISPGANGRGAAIEFRRVFNPEANYTNLEPKLNPWR